MEVVNESKSIPQSIPAGRLRRRAVAVKLDEVDRVVSIVGFEYTLLGLVPGLPQLPWHDAD